MGELLEKCMFIENLISVNDRIKTCQNSDSVINLYLVKPHLKRNIIQCATLIEETVCSEHIAVLLEIPRGENSNSSYSPVVDKFQIHKKKLGKVEWISNSEIWRMG